ncbi:MAG: hypothetical protein HUU57_05465 [Bdellovibrio sp.]|nr:hypothetical protein [Bdellovibrio sp.]
MFKMMCAIALVLVPGAFAQAYTLEEIAQYVPELNFIQRDADKNNQVVVLNAKDAKRFCELVGGHLPDIEEVTRMAVRLGAKYQPITAFLSTKDATKAGYTRIQTGIVNIEEAFFFSSNGYSHFDVKELKNRFWTTSKVYSFMPTQVNPYIFDGTDGSLAGSVKSDVSAAVICLPGLY